MAESKPFLKLFVHTKEKKVVFAEADKFSTDFLLNALASSHTTITDLLGKDKMVGCMVNVYESISKLGHGNVCPKCNQGSGNATKYMVMDDLVVKPMSFFSAIARVDALNVSEPGISAFMEIEVEIDLNEVLEILRISMVSDTVLTTVFLRNMNLNIIG